VAAWWSHKTAARPFLEVIVIRNALAFVAGVITAMFVVALGVFALLNLSPSQQQLKRMSANQSGSRESAQVAPQDADPFEPMAGDEPVITYVIFPLAAAAAGLIVGIVARKHGDSLGQSARSRCTSRCLEEPALPSAMC
jgi:hypothetical protein